MDFMMLLTILGIFLAIGLIIGWIILPITVQKLLDEVRGLRKDIQSLNQDK